MHQTPEMMIDYLVSCTLATVESMVGRKSTPKRGEFERQCNIAQKGIDFLGKDYPFTGRASQFAKTETAFEYYTRRHLQHLNYPMPKGRVSTTERNLDGKPKTYKEKSVGSL